MSMLQLIVNESTRKLSNRISNQVFVVNDANVDTIRFSIPAGFSDIDIDENASVRVMYIPPGIDKTVYAKTLTFVQNDGIYISYDWQVGPNVLVESGILTVSFCILKTGSEVQEWHTIPYTIPVSNTIHTDDSDEGDETITPTVAQRVAVLESMIQRVASGAPIVVTSTSAMTDTEQIYVLSTNGNWYYHNGSAWVTGGEYGAVATDTTLTQSGMSADAKAVGDAISGVRSRMPEIFDSDADNVDLDISDTQGNVIARFADGHIQTKEFDSSEVLEDVTSLKTDVEDINSNVGDLSDLSTSAKDSLVSAINEAAQSGGSSDSDIIKDSTEQGIDLDISDPQGNVVARFADGGIQTKRFNSEDVLPPIEIFSAKKTFVRGETNTITISQSFCKGDEIYFHLDDGYKYHNYGQYAIYYQGNNAITGNRRGSNGYFRHIITENCSSVGITVSGTEYTNGTELTLYVYRKNGEVKPKVVTVKSDGTGMFSTLKAAIESITDANHLTNPYIIEVYEGTYNTLTGYTEEEIQSADIGGGYTQDSMVGVKLTDGISLKGIGRADDIVLYAELNTTDYSSGVRGNISTLNIEGQGNIENLTIIGKHIRYCVHDDFVAPVNSHDKRILRDLKFKGEDLAYSPFFTTYGAGMNAPRDYLIENCDFGYDLGIHSNGGYLFGCTIEVNNCSGTRFRIGDSANAESNAVNRVIVNNCNFQMLQTTHASSSFPSHMRLEGVGNENVMVKDTLATLYRLGMVDLIPSGFTTGKMVRRKSSGLEFEATNNKDIACGIVVGSDENFSYVQKCGYIASNYLGITGLSVGDYITVDNTGSVISNGTASNAIGVVTAIDDGIGFIKLMI